MGNEYDTNAPAPQVTHQLKQLGNFLLIQG
jgi:hypothetical protein